MIICSLRIISGRGLIDVFAFVIMPNHIHLIWSINGLNKKETAQGSFLKFTAHKFKKLLKNNNTALSKYAENTPNKEYEFWQQDPLAIHLYSRYVMLQKLNYIHLNPLSAHRKLVNHRCDYCYSSARFYEMGVKLFDFVKDVRAAF
jgi:REP element-mobilizing transposase RayT